MISILTWLQKRRLTIFLILALVSQVYLVILFTQLNQISTSKSTYNTIASPKIDSVNEPQPLLVSNNEEMYKRNRYFYQRGNYTVFTNYVHGTQVIQEFGTVTLVTHATVNYLDHILSLAMFWRGPISVAIYAPKTDFDLTLKKISLYRSCSGPVTEAIRSNVTFHIFFETNFFPDLSNGQNFYDLSLPAVECPKMMQKMIPSAEVNFRTENKLFYPINVARNIGREMSRTHFVLVSDIELLPNPPDFIPKFLDLMQRHFPDTTGQLGRQVFVLPPFELIKRVKLKDIPRSKAALQVFLKKKKAFPFHYYACFLCHKIPSLWNWIHEKPAISTSKMLNIFHSSEYITGSAWEPFYVGTRYDPPFDESFYRENALNKVIQAAILCHQNYTFHILDKAFLVHLPGLKYGKTYDKYELKNKGIQLARRQVLPLQFRLYGRTPHRCWQIDSMKPL